MIFRVVDVRAFLRSSLVVLVLVAMSGVAVFAASARVGSFGVAPTRACLMRAGVVMSPSNEVLDGLPSGVRSRVIAGTAAVPAGSGPSFVYVVVGRSAADAVAVRGRVRRLLTFPPTASNSVSGASGNVAWLIESVVGQKPSVALQRLVAGCLRVGSVPSGAPRLTRAGVASCLRTSGGDVLDRASFAISYPNVVVSDRAWNRMIYAFVLDGKGSQSGIVAFVFFGDDAAASLRARASFLALMGGALVGQQKGATRGVAWFTAPSRRATAAEATGAMRVFHRCLA